jgi:hypothetical protein
MLSQLHRPWRRHCHCTDHEPQWVVAFRVDCEVRRWPLHCLESTRIQASMRTNNGFLSSGISCNNAEAQLHSSFLRRTWTKTIHCTINRQKPTFGWWQLLEQSPSCEAKFCHFMEHESSLPRSQQPATCPYPEPDQSIPRLPIIFKKHFNIILPSLPRYSKWFIWAVPWLRRLVAGLSPRRPGFDPRSSPCEICGGQSDTGTGFSPSCRFSPVDFIPLVLHYL